MSNSQRRGLATTGDYIFVRKSSGTKVVVYTFNSAEEVYESQIINLPSGSTYGNYIEAEDSTFICEGLFKMYAPFIGSYNKVLLFIYRLKKSGLWEYEGQIEDELQKGLQPSNFSHSWNPLEIRNHKSLISWGDGIVRLYDLDKNALDTIIDISGYSTKGGPQTLLTDSGFSIFSFSQISTGYAYEMTAENYQFIGGAYILKSTQKIDTIDTPKGELFPLVTYDNKKFYISTEGNKSSAFYWVKHGQMSLNDDYTLTKTKWTRQAKEPYYHFASDSRVEIDDTLMFAYRPSGYVDLFPVVFDSRITPSTANKIQDLEYIGKNNKTYKFESGQIKHSKGILIVDVPTEETSRLRSGVLYVYAQGGVSGQVFHDKYSNCKDSSTVGLSGVVGVIEPGSKYVRTDKSGYWHARGLVPGNYTFTVDTTSQYTSNCALTTDFTVGSFSDSTLVSSIGLQFANDCQEPNISISMPFIRPCFKNQKIYVRVENKENTSIVLSDKTIRIVLDSLLIFESSDQNLKKLDNFTFEYEVAMLYPGEVTLITLDAQVSCEATLGTTVCLQAGITNPDSCTVKNSKVSLNQNSNCTSKYDSSNYKITSYCDGQDVVFTIKNSGSDADCSSPLKIFQNGSLLRVDSLQLQKNEEKELRFSSTGDTYWIQVFQHPDYPNSDSPTAFIEGCGSQINNIGSSLSNSQNDADSYVDTFCGIVTGSYDPNDKQAIPSGVGSSNKIPTAGNLEYVIRFQNTGTDTAFTVVIRDTLNENLSISSVKTMSTSHPYSFRLYGDRVLEWTFSNILLPDSNTNEEKSHGFVHFKVNKVWNIQEGDIIENKAAIYFDFNDPIITNTTSQLVDNLNSVMESDTIVYLGCDDYTRNGKTYQYSGQYTQVFDDSILVLDLKMKDYNSITGHACSSYSWNSETYDTSGVFQQMFTNVRGCDSIVDLNLSIGVEIDTSITSCAPYYWNGIYIDSTGVFQYTKPSIGNCDSTFVLKNTFSRDSTTAQITDCWGAYLGSTFIREAGVHRETVLNTFGCDSILILELKINRPDTFLISNTYCTGAVLPNGNVAAAYTSGTSYTTIESVLGCDSVIKHELTILPRKYTALPDVCSYNSYFDIKSDSTYTSTVQLVDSLSSVLTGCDSLVYFDVNIPVFDSILQIDSTGNVFSSNGSYFHTWYNCLGDSLLEVVSNSDNSNILLNSSIGSYTATVKSGSCEATTRCIDHVQNSILKLKNPTILVSPNPTTNYFTVVSSSYLSQVVVSLSELSGKVIYNEKFDYFKSENIGLTVSKGVYLLRVVSNDSLLSTVRIVKL